MLGQTYKNFVSCFIKIYPPCITLTTYFNRKKSEKNYSSQILQEPKQVVCFDKEGPDQCFGSV